MENYEEKKIQEHDEPTITVKKQFVAKQPMDHRLMTYFGKSLHVFTAATGEKYLLGVQVASLLNRETYNVYRSMKVKKIENIRATSEQVLFLASKGAVHYGTHSVTLVPFEDGLYFLDEALQKSNRNWFNTKQSDNPIIRPHISRRKAPPWEVRKSLSKPASLQPRFAPLFSKEEMEELEALQKS